LSTLLVSCLFADSLFKDKALSFLIWAGPAWFISRLGVDFRENTEAPQQERTVVGIAVHADALVPEILSEVKASIDQTMAGMTPPLPPLPKAHLVVIDPPFGLGLHLGDTVSQCDRAWDKEAWTGATVVEALKSGCQSGFVHSNHTLLIYLAP
jgi:hypothetical protein